MLNRVRSVDLFNDEIFGKNDCNTIINNLDNKGMVIVDDSELRQLEDRCNNLVNIVENDRSLGGNNYTSITTQEVEPPEETKEVVESLPKIEVEIELKIVLIKELNKTLQMLLENAKGSKGKQMREQAAEIGEKIKTIIK